jgi:hypothetical protein
MSHFGASPSDNPNLVDGLWAAYWQATQNSDFKGGFLARTSHELRSPLSSAMGLHQLILSDLCEDAEEEREFVAQAHQALTKLVKLLDRLTEVSKLSHGTLAMTIKPVDLEDLLGEVEMMVMMQVANRNLRWQADEPPAVVVLADHKRLQQAVMALIEATIAHLVALGDGGGLRLGAIAPAPHPVTAQPGVMIYLDSTCDPASWHSAIAGLEAHTLQTPPQSRAEVPAVPDHLSPDLSLWIAQLLLETMGGTLRVAAIADEVPGIGVLGCRFEGWLPKAED